MSKLLLDEYPILIYPSLACVVGLNESIVLQQIHYWLEINRKAGKNVRDGMVWVYSAIEDWQKQFPFWSESTVKRVFASLEKSGIIVSGCYNRLRMDRTKWYSIDYAKLDEKCRASPLGQNDPMHQARMTRPIPETTTETKKYNKASLPVMDTPLFDEIMPYYNRLYETVYHMPHPMLKSDQRGRVELAFREFCSTSGGDVDTIMAMAEDFFEYPPPSTDYNINHFATDGMLEIRAERVK